MQLRVIRCAAVGLTAAETAVLLDLRLTQVQDQLRYARRALAAKTIAHAVAICCRARLIP
jgi:DNA-directed RNA polymerase specialized sigma24 family protein